MSVIYMNAEWDVQSSNQHLSRIQILQYISHILNKEDRQNIAELVLVFLFLFYE